MYIFIVINDNGSKTTIHAENKTEAIKKYCALLGCPEEYTKKHCLIKKIKNIGDLKQ